MKMAAQSLVQGFEELDLFEYVTTDILQAHYLIKLAVEISNEEKAIHCQGLDRLSLFAFIFVELFEVNKRYFLCPRS